MNLVRIEFKTRPNQQPDRDRLECSGMMYLLTLRSNGHLVGEFLTQWESDSYIAYAAIPHPDALAPRLRNSDVKEALQQVTNDFSAAPIVTMLGEPTRQNNPNWKRSNYLLLHWVTDAESAVFAITAKSTKQAIPLYLLPISSTLRKEVVNWSYFYSIHYKLWLSDDSLEVPAYKELASPDSDFSARGRTLCREIEAATSIPTYYHLFRYWGRKTGEEDRRCSGCGRPWKVEVAPTSRRSRDQAQQPLFPLQCQPCRLVSEIGSSVDNQRRARIGEYNDRSEQTVHDGLL